MQPGRRQTQKEREPLLINKLLKCPGPESLPNRSAKQEACPHNQVRPGGHAGQGGDRGQHRWESKAGMRTDPQRGPALCPALGFSENNPKPPNTGTALGLPARLRDSHVELLV